MPSRSGSARVARLLGQRIKALRVEAGLTQEEVAWSCDVSKAHLSQIEAGKGYPSMPVLLALAKRMGLRPVDIVAYDPADPRTQLLDAIRRDHGDLAAKLLREIQAR